MYCIHFSEMRKPVTICWQLRNTSLLFIHMQSSFIWSLILLCWNCNSSTTLNYFSYFSLFSNVLIYFKTEAVLIYCRYSSRLREVVLLIKPLGWHSLFIFVFFHRTMASRSPVLLKLCVSKWILPSHWYCIYILWLM